MSRPQKADPKYRFHRPSGQAVVTLSDAAGRRRDVYLGVYRSPASKREYARVLNEWQTRQHHGGTAVDTTVNELILAFLRHAAGYYGSDSQELKSYADAFRPLKAMYGSLSTADFGPLKLKTLRQQMIDKTLSRSTVNGRVARIKRLFKWGASEELVVPSVFHGLQAVAGLARGRSAAKEPEPIKPVPEVFVDATLPHLLNPVEAMVRLQLLTGMRSGEVVLMRTCDLDMTKEVWLYRPEHHKTEWRGRNRVIAIGPKAQVIIREFLTTDLRAYLFSPAKALAERSVELRAKRKTPVQPSQLKRRKRSRKHPPGDRYTSKSYRRAVARGIQLANRAIRRKAAEEGREVADHDLIPDWHPHQLRHSKATEVRRTFGLEAAQVTLGHANARITECYAERDLSLAIDVARKTG